MDAAQRERQTYLAVRRGLSSQRDKDWAGMAESFTEFIQLSEAEVPTECATTKHVEDLARAYSSLSTARANLGDQEGAVNAAERAVQLGRYLNTLGFEGAETLGTLAFHLAFLGTIYMGAGRYQDAVRVLEEAEHTCLTAAEDDDSETSGGTLKVVRDALASARRAQKPK